MQETHGRRVANWIESPSVDDAGADCDKDWFFRSITPPARDARYGPVAVFFHWMSATLVLVNWLLPHIAGYLARTDAPRVIALDRSIGVTVLALVLMRAAWRFLSARPPLPGGTLQLVRIAAHL